MARRWKDHAGIRGRNFLTFLFGNRRPDGTCCLAVPGFSNILVSDDGRRNWFDAMYLTVERPFDSKWGFRVNYTLGAADAIGGDLFSLDYRRVEDYPRHPSSTDERHRLVLSGIVALPAGFVASTFTTLASGVGYTVVDNSRGSGFDQRQHPPLRRPAAGHVQLQDRGLPDREDLPAAAAATGVARVRGVQHLRLDELRLLQRRDSGRRRR